MAVNTFQASTGYRDPLKAMTIKALEARAKAAADATAQAIQPQTIAAPEQGWAQMIGALGANIQQGRAESAAASGRDALAQAMAGVNMDTGPSMQDIAIIGQHDPELAQRMYEQAMKTRQENLNREDTQEFTAGESLLERQQREKLEADRNALTQSESALQRGSTEGIAARGLTSQAELNAADNASQAAISGADNASQAAISAANNTAAAARTKAEIDARTKLEEYKQSADPDSPGGKIVNDYNQGVYNIPGEDQNHPNTIKRFEDELAAQQLKDQPQAAPGSDYLKRGQTVAADRHGKIVEQGNAAVPFMSSLRQLGQIGRNVGTGKLANLTGTFGPWLELIPGVEVDKLGDIEAYNAIASKLAPNMRPEGSGSTSNYDAEQFLRSLPSIGNDPQGNAIIEATFLALEQNKKDAAAIARRGLLNPKDPNYIEWQKVDEEIAALKDPFTEFAKYMEETGANPANPANPADPNAGGGEPVKPADIPQAEWDAMPPEDKALFR